MSRISGKTVPAEVIAHAIGGHVALDFCNTAGEHLAESPLELMPSWEHFVRWAVQVGLLGERSYSELAGSPAEMGKVLALREAIYRCGMALARGRTVPAHDIELLRREAKSAKPEIAVTRGGLQWRPDPELASSQMRALLASEALSLFCSSRAPRLGICEGGECGWLFLDDSRGKRRRWCDMKDCGNRAKARRHYQQKNAAKEPRGTEIPQQRARTNRE